MNPKLQQQYENAHDGGVWCAQFANVGDQELLLTGSMDETVRIWTVGESSIEPEGPLQGHALGVISIAVDSGAKHAATSALDSTLRVISLPERTAKASYETAPTECWQVAFHPKEQTLAVAGGTTGKVFLQPVDSSNDKDKSSMDVPANKDNSGKARQQFVLSVAFSPDGTMLAAGAHDGTVALFDVASRKLLHKLPGHHKPVRWVTWTPDSKGVLTACDDMQVLWFDAEEGSLIQNFSGPTSWVLCVACHPDGQYLATTSSDTSTRIIDLRQQKEMHKMQDHTDQVWQVCFHQDGNKFVTVSDDRNICLYSST